MVGFGPRHHELPNALLATYKGDGVGLQRGRGQHFGFVSEKLRASPMVVGPLRLKREKPIQRCEYEGNKQHNVPWLAPPDGLRQFQLQRHTFKTNTA